MYRGVALSKKMTLIFAYLDGNTGKVVMVWFGAESGLEWETGRKGGNAENEKAPSGQGLGTALQLNGQSSCLSSPCLAVLAPASYRIRFSTRPA